MTAWTPRRIGPAALIITAFLLILYRSSVPTPPDLASYGYPLGRDPTDELHRIDPATSPSIDSTLPSSSASSTAPTPSNLWKDLIPSLQRRLKQKVLSHHDALKKEIARCPTTHLQANQDQLQGNEKEWEGMTGAFLEGKRREVAEKVVERLGFTLKQEQKEESKLSAAEWDELFGVGRGLVFTAGNKDTAARLLTSLRILRTRHNCQLPVEIWGFPHELNNLGPIRTSIEALGAVEFREINSEAKDGLWKQFQIKGEAIARSSFSEILYLDSDNIPVRDPTYLFDSPSYLDKGVVLWPDFGKDAASNPIWRTVNKPCDSTEWQIESGQILINKLGQGGQNLVGLLVAEVMQADFDFWFKMSGGDKDTFRYAFYFLDLPYTRAPHYLSSAGAIVPSYEGGHAFCGHTMLQYGLSSEEWQGLRVLGLVDEEYETPAHAPPLFVHANLLKHSGYNNNLGSTFKAIKYANPDTIHSTSFAALTNDLRNKGFNHRGICTDLWDAQGDAGEGLTSSKDGAYESGRVKVVVWEEAWGGLLRDFEQMYYSEGGQAGAW